MREEGVVLEIGLVHVVRDPFALGRHADVPDRLKEE
jgi:hypothetical protein